ncbi:MAG: hypothetical protein FK730_05505 [Asgard group archaeon]|nr:hypothetical protein [Asgard group archaeon]
MKRMDIPSLFIGFFAILNALAISWMIGYRSEFTRTSLFLFLGSIILFTLSMISLWELYEFLLFENKRLRVAIIVIMRIVTLASSALGLVAVAYFFAFGNGRTLILNIRDIFKLYDIAFLIGCAFVPLLYLSYTIITLISVIRLGSYQFKSPQFYRIREFAQTIVKEDYLSNFPNHLKEWVLYIPGVQSFDLFKEVVNEKFSAKEETNDLIVIAKPFAVIFPQSISIFREYIPTIRKKKQPFALELINAIEDQIKNADVDAEVLTLMEELKSKIANIKAIQPLIANKKIVPIETIIEETNLSKEQIVEISKYIDREVYKEDLLTNIQLIRKLQKAL